MEKNWRFILIEEGLQLLHRLEPSGDFSTTAEKDDVRDYNRWLRMNFRFLAGECV